MRSLGCEIRLHRISVFKDDKDGEEGVHPRGCGFMMEAETWVGLTGGGRSQRGGFHGSKLWLWDR